VDPEGSDAADVIDVAGSPAVMLLVTRAQETRPQFALGPDNIRSVVELCRQLDGSPLALELAAARMRSMRPDEVLARLSTAATLRADPKTPVPPRHRDLDAVVDWS
jgi:predicted ATPase